MKKLIYCLVAMCCILPFVGCDKDNDDYQGNIIRLSDENLTRRFINGDDVDFYYKCQFATDVKFQIMPKNSSTVLHTETASITPGEGVITFNIETDGYEGQALLCLTYRDLDSVDKPSTHILEAIITTRGSWYYENEAINELLEGCKDFDSDTLVSGLVDEWGRDSYLKYNDDWSKIIEPYRVIGYDYIDGLAYEKYNFNADGTGWHSVNPTEPDMETMTYDFNWSYDAESNQLTLSGEYNHKWRVTGCNDNYIVLDETTTNGDNLRTILRRSLL